MAAPIPDATTSFAAKAGLQEKQSAGPSSLASSDRQQPQIQQGDPVAAAWAAAAFERGKIPEEAPPEVFCR